MLLREKGRVGKTSEREYPFCANVYLCVFSAVVWGRGQSSGLAGRLVLQDTPVRKAPRVASLRNKAPSSILGVPQRSASAGALCPPPPQSGGLLSPRGPLLSPQSSNASSRKSPRWWLLPRPSGSLPLKWASQQLQGLSEAVSPKAARCAC